MTVIISPPAPLCAPAGPPKSPPRDLTYSALVWCRSCSQGCGTRPLPTTSCACCTPRACCCAATRRQGSQAGCASTVVVWNHLRFQTRVACCTPGACCCAATRRQGGWGVGPSCAEVGAWTSLPACRGRHTCVFADRTNLNLRRVPTPLCHRTSTAWSTRRACRAARL